MLCYCEVAVLFANCKGRPRNGEDNQPIVLALVPVVVEDAIDRLLVRIGRTSCLACHYS
jgi:hypothetical protein